MPAARTAATGCSAISATSSPSSSRAADADRVTLVMDFACASDVRELSIRDDLFDVLGPDHHTLAKIESGGEIRALAFATEAREARVSLAARQPSRGEGTFFRLGVEHILTGYDHLLFLGALLLRGGRLLSLFKIITATAEAGSALIQSRPHG